MSESAPLPSGAVVPNTRSVPNHFAAVALRDHEDYGDNEYTSDSITNRRMDACSVSVVDALMVE